VQAKDTDTWNVIQTHFHKIDIYTHGEVLVHRTDYKSQSALTV